MDRTHMRYHFLIIVLFVFSSGGGIMAADEYVYDSHGRRNPFLPPAEGGMPGGKAVYGAAVDTTSFQKWFSDHLSGILYDPGNPRVLIGDEIVEVGQEINKCTVVEIRPDGITFEYMTKRVEVPLRQEVEKEKKRDERK